MSHQPPLAVILDFDGVVADSLNMHLNAWVEAVLVTFGVPLANPDSIRQHSSMTIAHILAKRFGDPTAASRLAASKMSILQNQGAPPLVKGAARFIAHVEAQGLPWGIASNSPAAFVTPAVAALGLKPGYLIATDEPARRKPRPDIFWDCANQLGLKPAQRSRIMVCEDSTHGIAAAKTAGMRAFGIVGASTADDLRRAGAICVGQDLDAGVDDNWLLNPCFA